MRPLKWYRDKEGSYGIVLLVIGLCLWISSSVYGHGWYNTITGALILLAFYAGYKVGRNEEKERQVQRGQDREIYDS